MQMIFFLFLTLISINIFASDYFQYEFNFKEEHKKLTISSSGKFEYVTYGISSGCFDYNGKRQGVFKGFNLKKFFQLLENNSAKPSGNATGMFVIGKEVFYQGMNSKGLKIVNDYIFKALLNGKKENGVGLVAKRINNKKVNITFSLFGNKKKEIHFSKNINKNIILKNIEFQNQRMDELIVLDEKNKVKTITLESKTTLPKNEIIRYFDSNINTSKKKMDTFNNIHLCSNI